MGFVVELRSGDGLGRAEGVGDGNGLCMEWVDGIYGDADGSGVDSWDGGGGLGGAFERQSDGGYNGYNDGLIGAVIG